MANYGEMLDTGYDPFKEKIYNMFCVYFNNPIMTKIKDVNQFSMYAIKTNGMLGIEHRYIIVFVDKNNYPVGHEETLDNLFWVSIQTRTLTEDYKTKVHNYIPRRIPELDKKINLKHKDDKQYVYNVEDYPISVCLISKNKGMLEYGNSGKIINAIETFQTVINFL
jgi:hypothetical protein